MTYKIGDRIRHKSSSHVWEVVNTDYLYDCKNITLKSDELSSFYLLDGTWEYLGNFTKVDNFTELYELLNN